MSGPSPATRTAATSRLSRVVTLSRVVRVMLCVAGIALLGGGSTLLVPVMLNNPVSAGSWFVSGPVLHDGVVAVAVVVVANVLRRWMPTPWRGPVAAGLVLTAVVLALSVPLWWRAYAGPPNPGVRTEVWPGVLTLLVVVWSVVAVICAVVAVRRSGRSSRERSQR